MAEPQTPGNPEVSPYLPSFRRGQHFAFLEDSTYIPLDVSHSLFLNQIKPEGATKNIPESFVSHARRSNLVVASKRSPLLFIAHNDQIGVYHTPSYYGLRPSVPAIRMIRRPYPNDQSLGYLQWDAVLPKVF
jgi:hypothetical protein